MPEDDPVRTEPWPYTGFGVNLIGEEEMKEVREVMESKSLFRFYGPDPQNKVLDFESEFSEYVGTEYALGVSSGTAAVHLGVKSCGIGPGEEVIVPPVTFIANISPVLLCGGVPVFADVEGETLNLDPDAVRQAVTPRTKAIVPVHLLGFPADMDGLRDVAEENDLYLVEDASHAHGSEFKGGKVGSLGDIGCFSFQLNKMATSGEGGIVTTDDPTLYDNAIRYHDHGNNRLTREEGAPLGTNYRMSELQGAVALAQVRKLDRIVEIVNKNANYVNKMVEKLGLIPRKVIPGSKPVYYGMIYRIPDDMNIDAPGLIELIKEEGVPAGLIYGGRPAYDLDLFKKRETINRSGWPFTSPLNDFNDTQPCPVLEDSLKRNIVLPNSTNYTDRELDDLVEAVEVALGRVGGH